MQQQNVNKALRTGIYLVLALVVIYLGSEFISGAANAAPPPAQATTSVPAEHSPTLLERLKAGVHNANPFGGPSEEEKLEIVKEYNAGTAAAGQRARALAAQAQRDATIAANNKAVMERRLQAITQCINVANSK